MNRKINIGAFISGGGTNLQSIINSCESGTINGNVTFIASDNPNAFGLKRGKKHNIPTFTVDYKSIIKNYPDKIDIPSDFNLDEIVAKQNIFSNDDTKAIESYFITRAIAEAELIIKMKQYPFDLLILAGFMRYLTPYFIDRINIDPKRPRIMNIHPALLPSFPGVDGYGDTFRYGCKVGGCTVHFIDYGEDSGSIIGQRAFQITKDDTLDSVKRKGLQLEWELYTECINLFDKSYASNKNSNNETFLHGAKMTYKERLIMFLKAKDLAIHEVSKIRYINEKDIYEIENWSENDCKNIYKHMVEYINRPYNKLHYIISNTCPWCIDNFYIKKYKNCNKCGYGKRYGICDTPYSRYKELLYRKAFSHLTAFKYKQMINDIENNK